MYLRHGTQRDNWRGCTTAPPRLTRLLARAIFDIRSCYKLLWGTEAELCSCWGMERIAKTLPSTRRLSIKTLLENTWASPDPILQTDNDGGYFLQQENKLKIFSLFRLKIFSLGEAQAAWRQRDPTVLKLRWSVTVTLSHTELRPLCRQIRCIQHITTPIIGLIINTTLL